MRIALLLLMFVTTIAAAQRRPPALYFQAGGEGLGLSANLDVGVTQSLRLRGGAGWFWTAVTVPLTASYLIGSRGSTLEVGGGATILAGPPDRTPNSGLADILTDAVFFEGVGTKVFAVGILGWRYHPKDGAVIRVTATPFYGNGRAVFFAGASLGFTF
ncbi:MAG TPA: hypothetical protein VG692_06790 [Gemmatimonadales bacterium]|nr:hypothetical protein [Gemmatimonadales bacterium]